MSKLIIEGDHKLTGSIEPQGAKNEALQVISATLLTSAPVRITNIPEILDVRNLILLLEKMGVKVSTKTGRPRPRCAAIVPELCFAASVGCKTPTLLQQNPLPVLWEQI